MADTILSGNYGGELDAIHCGLFNDEVVERNQAGQQAQTEMALRTTISVDNWFKQAPDNCPLTIDPNVRELSSFAVCNACSLSTILYPSVEPSQA